MLTHRPSHSVNESHLMPLNLASVAPSGRFITKQEYITPKQAHVILDAHERAHGANRDLRKTWIADLANRMRTGQWLATHQGIAIAPSGVLLDGQHRMLALLASGIDGILINVSRGIDPATRDAYDGGSTRTTADHLGVSRLQSACCNFIHRLMIYPTAAAKTSVQDARLIWQWSGPFIEICSPKNNSKFSATSITAAMATQLMRGPADRAGFLEAAQAFYHIDFDGMTPSMKALAKQIVSGHCTARSNPLELFFKAWRAFDPKFYDRTLIRSPDRALALECIRATYNGQISAHTRG